MSLKDLNPDDQILALTWMRDAIIRGIRSNVGLKAYWEFCRGRTTDGIGESEPFDPEAVWSRLRPHEQNHFLRVAETIDRLDTQIAILADQIDADESPEGEVPARSLDGIQGLTGHPGPTGYIKLNEERS